MGHIYILLDLLGSLVHLIESVFAYSLMVFMCRK